jgi:hypothetical protein
LTVVAESIISRAATQNILSLEIDDFALISVGCYGE